MAMVPKFMRSNRRFDQRITVQRQSTTRDEMNQEINEWEDLFHTRAIVYPSPGTEKTITDARVATEPMTFLVRAHKETKAITSDDRIIWKGQPYNILSPVVQQERGRNIRIFTAADNRS